MFMIIAMQPKIRRESRGSRPATLQPDNGVLRRCRKVDDEQERGRCPRDGRRLGDGDIRALLAISSRMFMCRLACAAGDLKQNVYVSLSLDPSAL